MQDQQTWLSGADKSNSRYFPIHPKQIVNRNAVIFMWLNFTISNSFRPAVAGLSLALGCYATHSL